MEDETEVSEDMKLLVSHVSCQFDKPSKATNETRDDRKVACLSHLDRPGRNLFPPHASISLFPTSAAEGYHSKSEHFDQ